MGCGIYAFLVFLGKGRTIRKVMGGGGGGWSISNLYDYFFKLFQDINIFLIKIYSVYLRFKTHFP